VDEPEAGCEAERDDHGVHDAVEAGVRGGQRLVDGCAAGEIGGVVVAAGPLDAGAFGVFAVEPPDAGSLAAAQLLHGEAAGVFAGEAHGVHLAGHAQPRALVGHERGLSLQQRRGAGEGPFVGVVAHAVFADPNGGGAALGDQHHGLLADGGAGSEQDGSQYCGGDVSGAACVAGGDGVGVAVDDTVLEVDEAEPVLGSDELPERDRLRSGDLFGHDVSEGRRGSADRSRSPWPGRSRR
jgi:hypothetical protein